MWPQAGWDGGLCGGIVLFEGGVDQVGMRGDHREVNFLFLTLNWCRMSSVVLVLTSRHSTGDIGLWRRESGREGDRERERAAGAGSSC